jgi:hypothetical protein
VGCAFRIFTYQTDRQHSTRQQDVETHTTLLFARAALERYAGSKNLVKVLACLFGDHRNYLAKLKYAALRAKVSGKSSLAEVWPFDVGHLNRRRPRTAKIGINYDEREDPNSAIRVAATSDVDSETDYVRMVELQYAPGVRNRIYTAYNPADALNLLESAHSSQQDLQVLRKLKLFAKVSQNLQSLDAKCTSEALAFVRLCPAIVISARTGIFVATDDSMDYATVEDILSLLPHQCMTVAGFHKTISSAISLAMTEAVVIVPTSLFKQCIFNPSLSNLDKLADYFRPVVTETQCRRSKTVLIHPQSNTQCLAVCEVTTRTWPHLDDPNKFYLTSRCEVVTICAGLVQDADYAEFEADLERLFEKIFPQTPVKWSWWTIEDEANRSPDQLHAVEWVIRTCLKINSARMSDAPLILVQAVLEILGPVRTGTICKLMGYESLIFPGNRPLPLVEVPFDYERTRVLALTLVSKELQKAEKSARRTYQTAQFETDGEGTYEDTSQFLVADDFDIPSVDSFAVEDVDDDLSQILKTLEKATSPPKSFLLILG